MPSPPCPTRASWKLWERLPDTPGKTIARLRQSGSVDGLAALLLSRHTLLSMAGGDAGEAGSGERLALRWTLSAARPG